MNNDLFTKDLMVSLYITLLKNHVETKELGEIKSILLYVYKYVDSTRHVEELLTTMVNYIRLLSFTGAIVFSSSEEQMLLRLRLLGQKELFYTHY